MYSLQVNTATNGQVGKKETEILQTASWCLEVINVGAFQFLPCMRLCFYLINFLAFYVYLHFHLISTS